MDPVIDFLATFKPQFEITVKPEETCIPSDRDLTPAESSAQDVLDSGFSLFGASTNLTINAAPTTDAASAKPESSLPAVLTRSNAAALLPRAQSYYLAPPTSSKAYSRFVDAALSASDIYRLSKIPWPGSACPWRVMSASHSPPSKALHSQVADVGSDQGIRRRTRKGKKTRLKIRRKHERVRTAQAAKERAERDKAEHEREKRAKMNRSKQLKKREKARLAKAAEGQATGGLNDSNTTQEHGKEDEELNTRS